MLPSLRAPLILLALATSCGGGQASIQATSTPAGSAMAPPAAPTPFAPTAKPDIEADGPPEPASSGDLPLADEGLTAPGVGLPDAAASEDAAAPSEDEAWCPEGIETLPGPICTVVPPSVAEDPAPTLVVFLHGVTNVGSGWQLNLIRGLSRYAEHQHFALLAPRAPLQPAKDRQPEMYAWRTSSLGADGEKALLDGWMKAKATLEQRTGHPFAHVFVMGFSSGAYYVSSLALRARLPVDGYAAFAGGSAPYSRSAIAHVQPRVPIFVGYGLKDRAGSRDARGLVAALRASRWKFREMAVRKAGHTITTSQFTAALAFLRGRPDAVAAASPAEPPAPAAPPTPSANRKKHTKAPASKPPRKSSKKRKH